MFKKISFPHFILNNVFSLHMSEYKNYKTQASFVPNPKKLTDLMKRFERFGDVVSKESRYLFMKYVIRKTSSLQYKEIATRQL